MGKDSKSKDSGSKGKGKQAAGGSEDVASKGKGKAGKGDGLGTCTYVKARHVLCEKQSKINEAYKKLQEGWLDNGDKVPPAEFSKVAAAYSECPSGKKGGDLGWFPRGKMAGPFQEVAFNTPVGATNMDTISFYVKGGRTEISEHLRGSGSCSRELVIWSSDTAVTLLWQWSKSSGAAGEFCDRGGEHCDRDVEIMAHVLAIVRPE
ncbi:hypothetical protein BC332_30737 [Capsicum chinense]|nr:hypothetical protein BC332_30737 [Capsicum chinense]